MNMIVKNLAAVAVGIAVTAVVQPSPAKAQELGFYHKHWGNVEPNLSIGNSLISNGSKTIIIIEKSKPDRRRKHKKPYRVVKDGRLVVRNKGRQTRKKSYNSHASGYRW